MPDWIRWRLQLKPIWNICLPQALTECLFAWFLTSCVMITDRDSSVLSAEMRIYRQWTCLILPKYRQWTTFIYDFLTGGRSAFLCNFAVQIRVLCHERRLHCLGNSVCPAWHGWKQWDGSSPWTWKLKLVSVCVPSCRMDWAKPAVVSGGLFMRTEYQEKLHRSCCLLRFYIGWSRASSCRYAGRLRILL